MTKHLLTTLSLALFVGTMANAQPRAVWGTDGQLVVSVPGRQLTTSSPGMFEPGWAMRSAAPDRDATNQGNQRSLRLASTPPINVIADAQPAGDAVALSYEFAPTGPVAVNSLHVAWDLALGYWGGGTWTADAQSGTLPVEPGATSLFNAPVSEVSVTSPGGQQLTWTFARPTTVLIQDNRQWGNATVTLRMSAVGGDGITVTDPVSLDVTLTAEGLEFAVDQPVTLAAGPEWVELDSVLDTVPGSALDFRPLGLLDGPAGQYGWLRAVDDRLEFEGQPGVPFRMYGVNFCFSAQYPEPELADLIADRLAMAGYNSVRLHHYERDLVVLDQETSLTLRDDQIQRLDYFLNALIERGIYITTDLFTSRPIQPAETVEGGREMDRYKMAVLVSDVARDNLKAWARTFLGHVNPHRGVSLAQDPALCSLSLVNEGAAGNFLSQLEGEVLRLFTVRWNSWLAQRYANRAALAGAWGDQLAAGADAAAGTVPMPRDLQGARGSDLARFLADVHTEFYQDMKQFLRDDLGCEAILTDINAWTENWPNQWLRNQFDYVDNHAYWDHPSFLENPWSLPSRGWSGGVSATANVSPLHRDKAITQLIDKPFGFSEFNYANPNVFRAESGPLTGAYAALQGWDAVWRFAYSHGIQALREPAASNYFDLATDPSLMASDRFATLLFMRDVREAENTVSVAADPAAVMGGGGGHALGTGGLSALSLVSRVGSLLADRPVGARELRLSHDNVGTAAEVVAELRQRGWLPADNGTDLDASRFVSDTGEITLDSADGLLLIDTAGTACIFSAQGLGGQAGPLSAGQSNAAIGVFLASLSDQPIAQADRLVLAHVPDVQATGRRFAESAQLTLLEWGRLPLLVRDVTTEVRVALDQPGDYTVWALGLDGARLGTVPATVEGGELVFTAASRRNDKGVMYYELTR